MSPTSLPPHPPSEYSSSPLSEEDVLVQLFRLISQGQSEQLRQQLELHVVVEVGAEREVEKDDDNNIILDECFSTKTPRLLEHRRQILLNSSYFKGHTLLTWAVSLGQRECVEVLLELGASPLVKTKQGWSPFNEATSYGDRQLMTRLYSARRDYWAQWFEEKGGKSMLQELSSSLSPELYLELSWQFQSWVPFVSNLCPSDNYKIYKKGNCLRIDTTLVGFESLTWIRGDISIIFKECPVDGPRLVILDHQRRIIQQLYPRDFTLSEKDLDEEISTCLNTKIMTPPSIDFSSFSTTRATNQGLLWGKTEKTERIANKWDTSVWNVDRLAVSWKTREEHLDEYAKILNGIGPTSEEEADSSNKNATSAALTMYEQTPASKSTTTFVLMNPDTDDESDEEEQLATQIEECFLNSDDEEEVVEEEYDKEYSEELYEGSDGAFEDEVDASSLTNCNSQHELSSQSSPLSSASTTNTALRIKAPIRAIKQIDELVFQSSSIRGRRSHRTNLSVTATTIDRNDGQLTEDEVVVDEVADEVADEWKSFRSVFEKISEHRPSLDPPPPPDARLLEALFSSDEAALESILQELEQKRVLEEEKTQNQLQQSPSSYTSPSSLLLDTPLHTSSSPNHIALPASVSTDYIHVGRPIKVETSSRDIRAVLWMYESPTKAKSTATKTATAPSSSSSSSWFSLATSLLTSANTSSSLSVTNLADEDEEQDEFLCDYLPVQSSHFPLSLKSIIPIFDLLGMVSPSVYGKHLQTLSDFFNVQLPPGFPVQIELPIGPPVVPLSLLLTFGEIKMRNPRYKPATPTTASTPFLDDALFVIPGRKQGYRIGEVIMDATSSESEINQ